MNCHAKLLLRAADRSVLVNTFGSGQSKALSAIPLHTASELVLYALGSDSYAERWRDQEICYPFVDKLDQAEKTRRTELICKALGVQDISMQLSHLAADPNVRFIIDNKVFYGNM
jgi:hypothetical protein